MYVTGLRIYLSRVKEELGKISITSLGDQMERIIHECCVIIEVGCSDRIEHELDDGPVPADCCCVNDTPHLWV